MRLTVACALSLTASFAAADEVLVFAAASLQGPLDQAAAAFGAATGDQVTISYAGSAALARQIIAGAPADLFLSAAPEWMAAVADAGLLAGDSRALFGNRLVIVGPAPAPDVLTPAGLTSALGGGLLAMGHVDSVPAGVYGKAALETLGLWDGVAAQVVQVDNVRIALGLVASGEAALGVVYATDALTAPDLMVVAALPDDSHPPILYPGGVVTTGESPAAAAAFLDWLSGADGQAPFLAAGFLPVAPG
jgi:molybdate transport system substrate-binding protein